MKRFYSPQQKPATQISYLGIGISPDGGHVGLFYRLTAADPPRFIHLAWDHALRNDPFDHPKWNFSEYFWAELSIPALRAKHAAHFCYDIFQSNGRDKIPYASSSPFGCFIDHVFHPSEEHLGLTCASFVIGALEHAGISLVERDGWKSRCDDATFFRWVIKGLSGELPGFPLPRDVEHIEKVKEEILRGPIRYKPVEVAGVAAASKYPIGFRGAVQLGERVWSILPINEVPAYMGA